MKLNRNLLKSAAAVAALSLTNAASAAVDISADVSAAKADIVSNGALIIGVIVAIAVIAWIRRIIK